MPSRRASVERGLRQLDHVHVVGAGQPLVRRDDHVQAPLHRPRREQRVPVEPDAARWPSSSLSLPAYGRADSSRACARRSFDAATIFMALVICCVARTERIRLLIDLDSGPGHRPPPLCPPLRFRDRLALRLEFLDRVPQVGLGLVVQIPRLPDRVQDPRVRRLHEGVEVDLPLRDLVDRHVVEQALRAGEQDRHLLLDRIVGGLDIPVLHLIFSIIIPILIAVAAVAYTVVNGLTIKRYHALLTSLTRQIEAIPSFGLDQIPVVAALFADTHDPALGQAIDRLQHDQDVLYQQRWLPDPARELTLEKLLTGMRLAALRLRPALTLLSIGLFAALISLLLRIQQPLANADLAAALPWPPALIGIIAALLMGIQSKTISERLRYDLAELSAMIGLRVPVFGQQTGIAQLIDSFFHYDRQMVASLDRFMRLPAATGLHPTRHP